MALKQLPRLLFGIQKQLLPALEEAMGPLNEQERRFVKVLGMLKLHLHVDRLGWKGIGRPPNTHLRRLCGWEDDPGSVPDKSVFSRAFVTFAGSALARACMRRSSPGNWARKSSNTPPPTAPPSKPGSGPIKPRSLRSQLLARPSASVADRAKAKWCDRPSPPGWSAILSTAWRRTSRTCPRALRLGLQDQLPGQCRHLAPPQGGSSAERVNSDLKDNHGVRAVRVRGAAKVMTHLMFGVLVMSAEAFIRLAG